jgi:hypothetical protein
MPNPDPQARLAVLAQHHDVTPPADQPGDFWPLAYAVADKAGVDPQSVTPGDGRAFLDALDQASGINSADDQATSDAAAGSRTASGSSAAAGDTGTNAGGTPTGDSSSTSSTSSGSTKGK